ncbi:MAG: endonuclease/exonuclease/phosphatase family protein [Geminicoccaceae bacterium]
MRLVTYNIQYGLGRDGRYDLARIAREVEAADVIALQEVERFWQRSGVVDEPAEIARHLPRHHWVFGANLDIDADLVEADGRVVHRRRQFGTMILSRRRILSSRNHLLPKYGTLTQHSIQQGTLEAVIDLPMGPLRVYSVHLSHLDAATRLPQIEALLAIHRRAPREGGAWCGGHPNPAAGWTEGEMPPMPRDAVFMGDFNFVPGSDEYTAMVGPLTARYGRLLNTDGLVDAWTVAGHDEGAGVTCDGKRLDYLFLSADLRCRVRSVRIDETAEGSDHLPVWMDFDAGRGASREILGQCE